MTLADADLGLFSVFDELIYDRSDADILSPAMRRHAIEKLKKVGFRQIQGTILEQQGTGLRCYIPKFQAIGASPFDITRKTPKRLQDFYLLTPTQTACQFIDHYETGEAVERIKDLIALQPINLKKLTDYLERSQRHEAFTDAIGHLRYVQRVAVSSEPLRRRRALG